MFLLRAKSKEKLLNGMDNSVICEEGDFVYDTGFWKRKEKCYVGSMTYKIKEIYYIGNGQVYEDTISQYIGKDDIDGNKIFQGDIVKDLESNKIYLVEHDDERCKFYLKRYKNVFMKSEIYVLTEKDFSEGDKLKIIGNKWDNKEILNSIIYGDCFK